MYKIKEKPEDFVVKEIIGITLLEKGEYSVYLINKKNYTTEKAVQQIAKKLGIERRKIGYAGTKDKNAVTSQYISIKRGPKKVLELKDIKIEFVGYLDKPLSLGDLKGNEFEITIRNLSSEEIKRLNKIKDKKIRFRNLFGEQRFSKNNAEIGKLIVKKDFKKAVELILEGKGEYERKVKMFLGEKKNDYINALREIPAKILQMYVHAYQSKLWNEMALEEGDVEKIPIIGFGIDIGEEIKGAVNKIMKKEGINFRDFVIRQIPELSCEGGEREKYATAEGFKIKEIEKDKAIVIFKLNKGCYATEFIRQILA